AVAATTATPNKSACLILMVSSPLWIVSWTVPNFVTKLQARLGFHVCWPTKGHANCVAWCPISGALAMRLLQRLAAATIRPRASGALKFKPARSMSARPQDLAHQDAGLLPWQPPDLSNEDCCNRAIAGVACFRHVLCFEQRPIRIGDAARAHLRVHLFPQPFDCVLVDRRSRGCGLHRPLVEAELLLQQRLGQFAGEIGSRIL